MYPGITERIKIKIPGIDDSELKLCYLKKLNCIKVNQISKLLNMQPQGISNKWSRLYNKVGDKDSYENIEAFIAEI